MRKDDHVIIDFKGRVDLPEPQKSKMEERMYGEAYVLHIGSNTFVPGFEEGLIGMKKGETKELEITFPEEYRQDALAGREAWFDVTVKEIKIEKLLPIDDEFAKDFGDFETLAELKQKISDDIKDYKESLEVNRNKHLVKERLVDLNSGFEIPKLLVEEQIDRFTRREAYMQQNRNPGVGDSKEEREKYRKMAEREARAMIVLSKIANKERLYPSEEEMNGRIAEFAMSLGKKVADILPTLEEKGYLDSIASEISEEKALNFVFEHVEITEVEPQEPAETAGEK